MADVIIPVASFGGIGNVSIRYDDVTLRIDLLIIQNGTNFPIRAGAVNLNNGQWVWVTCKGGQNRSYNIPDGYYLELDPLDGSLSYGQTEVSCQWPGEV